jgi:hypothetical protein
LLTAYLKHKQKGVKMSRIQVNNQWTTFDKLQERYGAIYHQNKKYYLTSDADFTGRQLPYNNNYNDVSNGEQFDFEMSANAIECSCYIIYWIFTDTKGDSEQELDSFDYDIVDRVKQD